MKFYISVLISLSLLLFGSCRTKKDLAYFDNIKELQNGTLPMSDYSIRIAPEDELLIVVSSEIPSATAQFNLPLHNTVTIKDVPELTTSSLGSSQSSNTPKYLTYKVNKAGDIDFPVLGEIHVAGMTTDELKSYLKGHIAKTVKDPQVYVQLVNFKVKVIGEVNRPQTILVDSERFSVIDAISACGDLTDYGKRDNIIIIREQEDGTMSYSRINLHDTGFINSPYYYLRQNDIVYVEPNNIKQDNSKYNTNNSYKLSVISTIVGTSSVIASLVIALTVK